mgnify:CR=1 FL=1
MPAKKRTIDVLTCEQCGTAFPFKQSGPRPNRFCTWSCRLASSDPKGRFWAKVNKNGPIPTSCPERGPCWLWTGSLFSGSGYGQFWMNGTNRRAHIVSYEWANGPSDDPQVQHWCNVRACVRPSHLTTGDANRNMQYASETGRMASGDRHWLKNRPDHRRHAAGERNGMVKLTESDVLDIWRMERAGQSRREIANAKRVTESTISMILTRRTWRHVTPPHD